MSIEPGKDTSDAASDRAVLHLLLDRRVLWHVDELVRILHKRVEVADSLSRLQANGMVHRLEGFVWPTAAADYADTIGIE